MEVKHPKRLGDLLIDEGIITPDQLKIALIEQKASGEQLGRLLVTLGFVSDDILRDLLSESFGQHGVSLKKLVPDQTALAMLDQNLARQLKVFPVSYDAEHSRLVVAMADTFNIMVIDRIAATLSTSASVLGFTIDVEPVLASEADLEYALDQFYGFDLSIDGILQELENRDRGGQDAVDQQETSHPLVRLIDMLLLDAVKKGASDIHFEPEAKYLRIRYRIDGVLRQIRSLHGKYWAAMAVRLKVISGMDITETRLPQDGRLSLTIGTHDIDFRVASQPTVYGENIVLRILDRQKGIVPIDQLQLSDTAFSQLQLIMARPEGIILITGPTGSGKTTTLYSMLNHLNNESVNIMTLEDPVEYPMSMVRQSSINPALKMDFASGIRSLMRQDPDIILVGEIRDNDTATMAFRAAMTGHKVFSTLHTNSAAASFPRLQDIGVKESIMTGNIIGIIGQRLLRRLCQQCRQAYQPDGLELRLLGLGGQVPTVYRAVGCANCYRTGYKGRLAIMEVLRIDADLDTLIARAATPQEIERKAKESGFKSLADEGIAKVLDGSTSLDELSRIVDLTHRIH
jgi:type II secretory ATPase GspE/PulE/Tfp pilus assembly ATPase PilB-like protein